MQMVFVYVQPDLVLSTGDFGEENVELVRDISNLNFSKAVILGNHDAWESTYNLQLGPSEGERDGVQAQLDLLGKAHVGYSRLDFAKLKLSVVGGRPFSSGGQSLSAPRLCKRRYAVRNLKESAEKILQCNSLSKNPFLKKETHVNWELLPNVKLHNRGHY
ncbi:hypothetical protein BDL97_03G018300 [Sphagnum fallax]|nr:hypothetical protein BDL97_03G018300 [Sphagnum fallax]